MYRLQLVYKCLSHQREQEKKTTVILSNEIRVLFLSFEKKELARETRSVLYMGHVLFEFGQSSKFRYFCL